MALLEINGLSLAFGGLQVVRNLNITVNEREIVSIIGPNGAGKSTTLNIITGINPPDSGDILFEGQTLLGKKPHEVTALGIARTFQTLRVFLNMSVIENVMAAAYCHTCTGLLSTVFRTPAWRAEENRIRKLAEEKLAFFGERLKGYRYKSREPGGKD
jgi:branched-chain amino acid transport system ATP-binding protein